ncbi:type 1 glutamine amidotransferase [Convivina praedatoris]|uniref:Glutamine amidotransferase domain-containing protein n=1 Tax=Convivina praedatoris TaxID=2880963 RepID=A0ABM9D5R0_9LACO|nr:type 1 glutamine amidotransferase [Convivina sp. LMG 32447]CAH1856953.1 hypothetical protein R077815_01506 [Convivina sp. LMG 32447]CAH1857216.1 hypothetical protein R078138_01538 [Convivina sp. LMG 32447]CAH1857425.1 hypothetical protein LMG032447_01538 [Convivina sp. LMG 32447]
MRINVLQHTPNEGIGSIMNWASLYGHDIYIYHPYQFDHLPTADTTDMLVILGGPMSPNDDMDWIKAERKLINQLLKKDIPMFGACYGAQQIAKTLGCSVTNAPYKEVGWAPVYRQNNIIKGLPAVLYPLHWHEEMAELPVGAIQLFKSDLVDQQGFLLGKHVLGLQFHFEPLLTNLREMVVNDQSYPDDNNALKQSAAEILAHGVPAENEVVMFTLLDYITSD